MRLALLILLLPALLRAEEKTIAERLEQYSAPVRERLAPLFGAADVAYPPRRLVLIGIKQDRVLELHAAGRDGVFRFIRDYPVLAASGSLGPKLRQGDKQVPEGIYEVQSLNPNSRFHLSLRLNYPNDFDRARAADDGRTNLGGDIMIHGNQVSIGCLAMGDSAAEDLFVLAAETGLENVRVILSPIDFRSQPQTEMSSTLPAWTTPLYEKIRGELQRYRRR